MDITYKDTMLLIVTNQQQIETVSSTCALSDQIYESAVDALILQYTMIKCIKEMKGFEMDRDWSFIFTSQESI